MKLTARTYNEYLKIVEAPATPNMLKESDLVIHRFMLSVETPLPFSSLVYMVDYTTKKYLYIDESCVRLIGYPSDYYYKNGLGAYLDQCYSLDFDVINRYIFPSNLDYLRTLSPDKFSDIIFSQNYRIRNSKGECVTLMQRYSYFPDKHTGKPAGVIGLAFDISHYKTDLNIIHTIEETVIENNNPVHLLKQKIVYPVFDSIPFKKLTRRENEILHLLSKGFSTKQIADKLSISASTVNNHRKQLLNKSGCTSSASLQKYAIVHGLL